jgi:hypothetical protein
MRKFLKSFGVLVIGLLMCAVCCSCNGHAVWPSDDGVTKDYVDSVVAASMQNYVNPLFTSVDEVLTFRDLTVEGQGIDDAFNSMPEDILKNVAAVCINRDGHVSKRGIVYEYRANSAVYNNLPTPDAASQNDTIKVNPNSGTSAGGQSYRQDSSVTLPTNEVSYTQHDTTIGGKTYKVRTKTEKKYE